MTLRFMTHTDKSNAHLDLINYKKLMDLNTYATVLTREVSNMNIANESTTNKAMQIETRIRSGISALGVAKVAKKMGIHHSQISRMQTGKNCFVERAARLLAVIGFDDRDETVIIKGEQTAEVAKALILMLEHLKGETPDCGNSSGAAESNA